MKESVQSFMRLSGTQAMKEIATPRNLHKNQSGVRNDGTIRLSIVTCSRSE